jgi:hypothetical protein
VRSFGVFNNSNGLRSKYSYIGSYLCDTSFYCGTAVSEDLTGMIRRSLESCRFGCCKAAWVSLQCAYDCCQLVCGCH